MMAARLAGPRIPAGGVGLAIRARTTRSASCRRRARKQSQRPIAGASKPGSAVLAVSRWIEDQTGWSMPVTGYS